MIALFYKDCRGGGGDLALSRAVVPNLLWPWVSFHLEISRRPPPFSSLRTAVTVCCKEINSVIFGWELLPGVISQRDLISRLSSLPSRTFKKLWHVSGGLRACDVFWGVSVLAWNDVSPAEVWLCLDLDQSGCEVCMLLQEIKIWMKFCQKMFCWNYYWNVHRLRGTCEWTAVW